MQKVMMTLKLCSLLNREFSMEHKLTWLQLTKGNLHTPPLSNFLKVPLQKGFRVLVRISFSQPLVQQRSSLFEAESRRVLRRALPS